MAEPRFDAAAALAPLKAFQRRTVDYVVRRLYEDPDRTLQFLVADEVGLGKTMVARGVIARAIERMWDTVDRIDVLYICSNQAIAAQNLNRLNVLEKQAQALPTRMTLLPLQLRGERGLLENKVNFVSLTPGTTFDLRSATGIARERALLLKFLAGMAVPAAGARRLFQVWCSDESWERHVNGLSLDGVDETLVAGFRAAVSAEEGLEAELQELCERFRLRRPAPTREDHLWRDRVIGRLRGILSHVCVSALEPDLVILDEFQRFPQLLHGDTDAALLAQQIFNFRDEAGNRARTLLLSATPYRMLTLSGDDPAEGDHYKEFLDTLRFLYGSARGAEVAAEIEAEMRRFRSALLGLPGTVEEAAACRDRVEGRLRKVIARTERVDSTAARDAMLAEPRVPVSVAAEDLAEARAVARVAEAAGAPLSTEYWKSAPCLLNFMRDYVLKRRLRELAEAPGPALVAALEAARGTCLDHAALDRYEPVVPANGRMRALFEDVFAAGLAERLWIPPAVPYYGEAARGTKALVFSSWSMVPDAISALVSYEAERRMGVGAAGMRYFERRRPRLLQFREAQGRLAGLRALLLLYPSPVLAEAADPLRIMAAAGPLSEEAMRAEVADRLRPHVGALLADARTDAEAATWDWAGPAILDARAGNAALPWIMAGDGLWGLASEDSYRDHVAALHEAASGRRAQGHPTEDEALELMVDLALGGPAICALRALRRVAPDLAWDDPRLLSAAAQVAWGFRTLYNQHDAIALLRRGDGEHYWRAVLAHGACRNLQAVLDEYVHVLLEAEGLTTRPSAERVAGLAGAMAGVLSLRPAQIEVDDPRVEEGRIAFDPPFHMRGRFAMRLSDYRDEEGGQARVGAVRAAFNSPFRPFVLASTSIGQEGLDFHPYCHRVYHWNLPANPVDLEQREGRVHRYKGHAVRLNVAADHAGILRAADEPPADPWAAMFAAARAGAASDSDLVPYWIYEGPAQVERRVLAPPFSREVSRLGWLKRSVAVYRLAFGQPRQDDLLAWLERLGETLPEAELARLQIRLVPERLGPLASVVADAVAECQAPGE